MTKFKLGDEVFDIRHGNGEVIGISEDPEDEFPIEAVFETVGCFYTSDGRDGGDDENPILMHLEKAKELGLYKEPVSIEVKVRWHKVTLESGDDMIVPIQLWDDRHAKQVFKEDFTNKTGTLTFVEDGK